MSHESIKQQVEEDVRRILTHILSENDIRDFSDDFDSILAAVDSELTTGDMIGEDKAYWGART